MMLIAFIMGFAAAAVSGVILFGNFVRANADALHSGAEKMRELESAYRATCEELDEAREKNKEIVDYADMWKKVYDHQPSRDLFYKHKEEQRRKAAENQRRREEQSRRGSDRTELPVDKAWKEFMRDAIFTWVSHRFMWVNARSAQTHEDFDSFARQWYAERGKRFDHNEYMHEKANARRGYDRDGFGSFYGNNYKDWFNSHGGFGGYNRPGQENGQKAKPPGDAKKAEKIRKLKAKAASTTNMHEKAALLKKIKELT